MSFKQYTQQKNQSLWSMCTSTLETQQGGHCGLFVQLTRTTQCSVLKTRSISDHGDSLTSCTKPGRVSSHIRSLLNLGSQHLRRTWDAKVSWSRTLQVGPGASSSLAYLLCVTSWSLALTRWTLPTSRLALLIRESTKFWCVLVWNSVKHQLDVPRWRIQKRTSSKIPMFTCFW